MHSQLASLFVAAINYPSITPANKSLALWGLGVYIYLDLLNKPPYGPSTQTCSAARFLTRYPSAPLCSSRKERITECLKTLVSCCCSPQDFVARSALEALASLINTSDMLERINTIDPVRHHLFDVSLEWELTHCLAADFGYMDH